MIIYFIISELNCKYFLPFVILIYSLFFGHFLYVNRTALFASYKQLNIWPFFDQLFILLFGPIQY